jgi:hypothetical protein
MTTSQHAMVSWPPRINQHRMANSSASPCQTGHNRYVHPGSIGRKSTLEPSADIVARPRPRSVAREGEHVANLRLDCSNMLSSLSPTRSRWGSPPPLPNRKRRPIHRSRLTEHVARARRGARWKKVEFTSRLQMCRQSLAARIRNERPRKHAQ